MPFGTSVAIIKENKILLTQREDFEVWCLPGGAVEMGESIPQAAMREAKEETGLTIELTRLVGLYGRSRGQEAVHNILFAAKPIAGALTPQVSEVINIGYFTLEEALNQKLLADHAQRITDALSGIGGSVAWWHDSNSKLQRYSWTSYNYFWRHYSCRVEGTWIYPTLEESRTAWPRLADLYPANSD